MITSIVGIVAMIGELINRIGQEGFIKYIGFSVIMLGIGITGVVMKNNYKLYVVRMLNYQLYSY